MSTLNSIGIIGAGNIGSVIGVLAAKAGFHVRLSNSRGPESLAALVASMGADVTATTVLDAARDSDLVVIAIPFSGLEKLPCSELKGKLVIDAMNFIPGRDDIHLNLLAGGLNASEVLQHRTNARVVKAFSNIYSGHLEALARPYGAQDRSALPIAADDLDAKMGAVEVLGRLGWDTLDVGSLSKATLFDVGQPAFVKAYMQDPTGTDNEWGARITTDPGVPLNRQQLSRLIDAAV